MKFYRDVLELKLDSEMKLANDYGYMLTINGEFKLWIGRHSEVKGKTKEPFRHIFNLYVASVTQWYNKIKDNKDVKIICAPEETPFSKPSDQWFVSTFLDPEGNCWQFMGGK